MLHPMLVVQVTALTAPVLDALDDAYALPCEGTGIFPLQASGHVPEGRGDAPCGLCELRGWSVHRGQEPAGEQKTYSVGGRECTSCGRGQGSSVVSDGVTSLHHYGATPVRTQATLNHSCEPNVSLVKEGADEQGMSIAEAEMPRVVASLEGAPRVQVESCAARAADGRDWR